jgi:hypothetical protein
MSTNVSTLLTGAMRLIGAIATGETPTAQELTDNMNAANGFLDSCSNERLILPNQVIESFPLTVNQQTYTLGPGGNFNTIAPLKINTAVLSVTQGGVPEYDLPVQILTAEEWSMITIKSTGSNIGLKIYPDYAYPLMNVSVWPVPTLANSLTLYSTKPLTEFVTINDTITVPPGFIRFMRLGIACELAPEYGKQIPENLAAAFLEAKANLKRLNFRPMYLHCDEAVIPQPVGFNWLTGEVE